MAVKCLATSSSTAHTAKVGPYLLRSRFLQPRSASALGFQPFTGCFSQLSLLLTCMYHVDSTLGSPMTPEIMCWSQNCHLSKRVNMAFSHTLALGNKTNTARTLPNPRQPWALLPSTTSQTYLRGHCSPKSWEVNFTVAFLSLSPRLVCAQTHIFLSLSPCCCKGILFRMKAFLCC